MARILTDFIQQHRFNDRKECVKNDFKLVLVCLVGSCLSSTTISGNAYAQSAPVSVSDQPALGISIAALNPTTARILGLDLGQAVMVERVAQGGAAEKAGLVEGDIILAVDQESISAARGLPLIISGKKVGERTTLTVFRKGRTESIIATLLPKPSAGINEQSPVGGDVEPKWGAYAQLAGRYFVDSSNKSIFGFKWKERNKVIVENWIDLESFSVISHNTFTWDELSNTAYSKEQSSAVLANYSSVSDQSGFTVPSDVIGDISHRIIKKTAFFLVALNGSAGLKASR